MNLDTLLLRQVHPTFVQDGKITSQVFRPTSKDERKISVYNGDMITAEESYIKFCRQANCASFGVVAVTKNECDGQELLVIEDRKPVPEHCLITFEAFSESQIKNKAKYLKHFAEIRGWLYRSEDSV